MTVELHVDDGAGDLGHAPEFVAACHRIHRLSP
jgi:hypothetical protein